MRPRFLIDRPPSGAATVPLPADEAHHAQHVLRLGTGDEVRVFDGAGREWDARIVIAGARGVAVEIGRGIDPVREPAVHVTLCAAWLRGDQMDDVVRDATALGVAAIVPIASDRVAVSKRARRGDADALRWRRVAVAAARQCGRAVVPAIEAPAPFAAALEAPDAGALIFCVEPDHATAAAAPAGRPDRARLFVGPEGGWSDAEVAEAIRRGARLLSLGPRTLRASLAPLVARAALWTEWGW